MSIGIRSSSSYYRGKGEVRQNLPPTSGSNCNMPGCMFHTGELNNSHFVYVKGVETITFKIQYMDQVMLGNDACTNR